MSVAIPLDSLTQAEAKRLIRDLTVVLKTATGPQEVRCIKEEKGIVYIPIGYDLSWMENKKTLNLPVFSQHTYTPKKKLLSGAQQIADGIDPGKIRDQQEIYDEVMKLVPDGIGSVALSISTGGGKTVLASIIAAQWGRKTLVICPNGEVLRQWESEFIECGVTVGYIINPTINGIPDTTVLLCSVEMGRKLKRGMCVDIGTIIYDEAHLSTVTCITETLLILRPAALIICTATLYRQDEAEEGLALYHGNRVIHRILKKTFTITRCNTDIVPDTKKKVVIGGRSRINYTEAISSINRHPNFCKLIVTFLNHIHATARGRLMVLFRENEVLETVSSLLQLRHFVANKKVKIKHELTNERIILAIDKKAKEGVDISGITDVVLTYSGNSIEQPEGRAREDNFRLWIFFHKHNMFNKHWLKALEWCEKRSYGTHIIEELDLNELKSDIDNDQAESSSV
jgi:hypothetical protein